MGLSMFRGDGRTLTVNLTDAGAPWTVPGGSTVRFTAKKRVEDLDSAAVIQKSSANAAQLTFSGAQVIVKIVPADTNSLKRDIMLHWDLQVTPGGGNPITVARDRLFVEADVTRTSP